MTCTKAVQEGRSTTLLHVSSLSLPIGESRLTSVVPFSVWVEFEHWNETRAKDWEEPSTPEFITIYDVRLLVPLYLTSNRGITVSLDARFSLTEILDQAQHDKLCEAILAGDQGMALNPSKIVL